MNWLTAWALILIIVTNGCGIGLEDSAGPDAARELKNEKLREEYNAIRGTYTGDMQLIQGKQNFPIRLYLWTGEIQESPLPGDLKPGIRVVLRARLMQAQFIGDSDNLILTGQYDVVTGRLRLDPDMEISRTPTGCRLGGQDPITISGFTTDGKIGGKVLRNGQEWATFSLLQRISTDVSLGSALSEEQEYQRLQQTYAPVTGIYEGSLSRRVCGTIERKEEFSLWLYIERIQEGTGGNGAPCFVPRLALRTLRHFEGELSDITYRSISRFDPGSFLPQFTSAKSKLTLDFKNSHLLGEIFTSGRWGSFDVARKNTQVRAPEDETLLARERLERTFSLFTGVYTGQVKAYSKKDWPVRLQVYVDETTLNGSRVPTLLALYKRPDFSDDTIGARLMQVTVAMDGCRPMLYMKSEPTGGGTIPGVGLMRFASEFVNGELSGELVDHRGPQGIMNLRRE